MLQLSICDDASGLKENASILIFPNDKTLVWVTG